MNCSLNWSFISCGELHCDSVKIKTQLVFLKTVRVFGLERLFSCFVIVGYSFPEERSRASNQGVFLIFTVFSGRRFLFSLPAPSPLPLTRPISSSLREVSTWRFREQIARSKKTPALQAIKFPPPRLGQRCQMPRVPGRGGGGYWSFDLTDILSIKQYAKYCIHMSLIITKAIM